MKKNILAFQTRSLLRNQKRSASLGYHRAQRVAVLVNADLNWKGLDDFFKVLESDHKETHVMHFFKTEQAPTKEHLYFSPFDFSIFGKIKSEELLEFVKPDHERELEDLLKYAKRLS